MVDVISTGAELDGFCIGFVELGVNGYGAAKLAALRLGCPGRCENGGFA